MSARGIRSIYGGLVLHEADAGYCKILSTDPWPLILGQCGPRPTLQSSVRPSASFHDRDAARRPKQLPKSGLNYQKFNGPYKANRIITLIMPAEVIDKAQIIGPL